MLHRIHILQHVPFEGPGFIEQWAKAQSVLLTRTCLWEPEPQWPALENWDLLVVLGGPMNADEHDMYPWLVSEKRYIKEAIAQGKLVWGICLGAQLIARVLGASVYRNPVKEIGWLPVTLLSPEQPNGVFEGFPTVFTPLHWHGETFDLPSGAQLLASSDGCKNQAFAYDTHVLAFQFHIEMDRPAVESILTACGMPKRLSETVQSAEFMVGNEPGFLENEKWTFSVLEYWNQRLMTPSKGLCQK